MAGSGEYLPNAVRETLDSVVSPEVREYIVGAALQSASMREIPQQLPRFREFLEGPLCEALMRALGAELGGTILAELTRVLRTAERDVVARTGAVVVPRTRSSELRAVASQASPPAARGRSQGWPGASVARASSQPELVPEPEYELDEPDSNPDQQQELRQTDPYAVDYVPGQKHDPARRKAITEPSLEPRSSDLPPASNNYPLGTANALGVIGTASVEFGTARKMPLVLVASTNPDLVRCFGAWLDPRATVQRVRTVLSMFQDLAEAGERRVVVVLDARSPSVRPLSLAAVADDLPKGTKVVLWGVGSDVYAKMLMVSTGVAKWLVCGTESSTSEVVAQCARMVS